MLRPFFTPPQGGMKRGPLYALSVLRDPDKQSAVLRGAMARVPALVRSALRAKESCFSCITAALLWAFPDRLRRRRLSAAAGALARRRGRGGRS